MMAVISPARHLVWSTDQIDLDVPFQRRWYIRQVLTHGRAQDVAALDLDEDARLLEDLNLPPEIHSLWARFLGYRRAAR
jgi:hypothetical protein